MIYPELLTELFKLLGHEIGATVTADRDRHTEFEHEALQGADSLLYSFVFDLLRQDKTRQDVARVAAKSHATRLFHGYALPKQQPNETKQPH